MSYASGHWYTSSVFWSAASAAIATVVIGALTAWVTWRTAYPKRRLYYALDSDTSLLPAKSIKGVEVRYGDKPLAAPRAVTVVLRNGGRWDIARDTFDGTPLRLDLSEHIVECLNVSTAPPDQPMPQVTTHGSVLAVEPVKISRRETISVELLIDGASPKLHDPVQVLTDVEIRPDPGDRTAWLAQIGWFGPVIVWVIWLASNDSSKGSIFGLMLAWLVIAVVGVFVGWQLAGRALLGGGRRSSL